jgi:peptidoglycan hydrolase-like protein with peptidoglycan-binding domain
MIDFETFVATIIREKFAEMDETAADAREQQSIAQKGLGNRVISNTQIKTDALPPAEKTVSTATRVLNDMSDPLYYQPDEFPTQEVRVDRAPRFSNINRSTVLDILSANRDGLEKQGIVKMPMGMLRKSDPTLDIDGLQSRILDRLDLRTPEGSVQDIQYGAELGKLGEVKDADTDIDVDRDAPAGGGQDNQPNVDDVSTGGLMTKPKARPDLFSPDETTKIKAVQKIIGTKADGNFGAGSKAKLKAWQYIHNLPTTGELDETTMNALKDPDTYDTRAITRNNFIQSKTFDLLKGVEGFKEEAYIGLIQENKYKSGLTVGAGLDFGQHTEDALINMGVPKSMIDKVKKAGWIGLNPDTIIDPETGQAAANRTIGEKLLKAKKEKQENEGTFPTFTYEELAASAPSVYKIYENAAREQYNEAVKASPLDEASFMYDSFDDLSEDTKAVLSLEKYHRGVDYDISAMIVGARKDDAKLTASKIKSKSRRKNMVDFLNKIGF